MAKKTKGMVRKYGCSYCGKTYAVDYFRQIHEKNCEENDNKITPTPYTPFPETKGTMYSWTHLSEREKKALKRFS